MGLKTLKNRIKKSHLSKEVRAVRLFKDDAVNLEAKMKSDGLSSSECLRKITAEYFAMKRLQRHGYDQTNAAVKHAQGEVIAPFKNTLDALENKNEKLTEQIGDLLSLFTNYVRHKDAEQKSLEEYLDRRFSSVKGELTELGKTVTELGTTVSEMESSVKIAALNIITVRGLFYVYLIYFRFGKASLPKMTDEQITNLVKMTVINCYKAAREEEINYSSGNDYEKLSMNFLEVFQEETQKMFS